MTEVKWHRLGEEDPKTLVVEPPFVKAKELIGTSLKPKEVDPHGKSLHEPGAKADLGKCKAGVLHDFALALQAVADVGTMGAAKYSRGGWQSVPGAEERYFDAMWRHLLASRHEELDRDSQLPHFAHFCWNALAIMELRKRGA